LKRNSNKARVRGAIAVIASLLLGSAVLRISLSASEVMAGTKSSKPVDIEIEADQTFKTLPSSRLLQAMLVREQRVSVQEDNMAKRKKALDVAQVEIERRLQALQQAEVRLSATLAKANTATESDVNQLIQVYESMKPKDTAALFETMEPAFAAGFLGRMRPDAAAGIMEGLSPKVAYTISVILAGRNANAPKN
jgi:flagellar motility protein MotE (MotC chaperone)